MPKLTHERLLQLCELKYQMFDGIEAQIEICEACFPNKVVESFDLTVQCGEDAALQAVVFVNNTLKIEGGVTMFMPTLTEGECKACKQKGAVYHLIVRLSTLLALSETVPSEYPSLDRGYDRVSVMGKVGSVIAQFGTWEKPFQFLRRYLIRFDDGTKFLASPWQIKVVKDHGQEKVNA